MENSDTFLKITNQDIFKELQDIKKGIEEIKQRNSFNTKWLALLTAAMSGGFIYLLNLVWSLK